MIKGRLPGLNWVGRPRWRPAAASWGHTSSPLRSLGRHLRRWGPWREYQQHAPPAEIKQRSRPSIHQSFNNIKDLSSESLIHLNIKQGSRACTCLILTEHMDMEILHTSIIRSTSSIGWMQCPSENLYFILFFCSERDKTLCNSLAYLTHTSISLSVSIPSFSCVSFSLQPLKAGDHLQNPGLLKVSSHWREFSCRRISWFSLWLCKSLKDAFGWHLVFSEKIMIHTTQYILFVTYLDQTIKTNVVPVHQIIILLLLF